MPPEKPTVTARRSPNPTFTGTLYSGKNRTTAVATKVDDSVEIRPKSVQSQFGKLVRYQFGAQHLVCLAGYWDRAVRRVNDSRQLRRTAGELEG